MTNSDYRADPQYDKLGATDGAPFYDRVEAAAFPDHILRYRNQLWAERIGLGNLNIAEWTNHFGRFQSLPDNFETPLAVRYHGHQFRNYNPDIGDGRGFLFAQLRDDQDRLLDLATKGSGQTPYSRMGDGRLTLKGGVREILATEMLEALGVYTSKSFSLIETGEALERNDEPSPTRSAVLVRLGHSHVRFGIFQRLAFEKNERAVAELVDYCIKNFDPDLGGLEGEARILAFYARVRTRTARLVAQWTAAGFVHGVLNTDNMNVTGESFDYGPWRFAPTADPGFTAAYFDQTGLYAFGRQAEAGAWNLAQLGGALGLIADADALTEVLHGFSSDYEQAMVEAFFTRIGARPSGENDFKFVSMLLQWMSASNVPYEALFFDWFCGRASETRARESARAGLYASDDFAPLAETITGLTPDRPERLEHKYFSATDPCTMLIEEVEDIWALIADDDDWRLFDQKLAAIKEMREAFGFDASAYLTS